MIVGAGRPSRPGASDDERHADLAEPLVGDADHRGLLDVGMAQQRVLDLGRVGVEAADDEHVLRPADDAQAPGVVDHAEVAGAQPAVGRQRLRGRLGIVEVVRHDAAAAQQDLAGLARRHVAALAVDDAQLEAGPGPADRRGDRLDVVVRARWPPRCRPR